MHLNLSRSPALPIPPSIPSASLPPLELHAPPLNHLLPQQKSSSLLVACVKGGQNEGTISYVGHVLLHMFLQLGGVGSVGRKYDPALQRHDDLGLAGRVQFRDAERLDLLLGQQDDVHALLELVDHVGLQVLVEGRQGLAGPAPGGVHVNDEQFGVFFVEVAQEVVGIADDRCQLRLLLGSHLLQLSYNSLIVQWQQKERTPKWALRHAETIRQWRIIVCSVLAAAPRTLRSF